ncbi:MAG: hypothetical protein ACOC0D_04310 [Spirochaeta sp.]
MFDLHLRLKPVKTDQVHIHIPVQFRALFGVLAVLTVWVAGITGNWNPVAIGVLLLAIFGSLYDERWIFDRKRNEVHYRIGFLFIGRHLVLQMREIDRFEFCIVHHKGRELCQIILWTIAQEPFLVESQPSAYQKMLLHEAEYLSDFCGRSLSKPE